MKRTAAAALLLMFLLTLLPFSAASAAGDIDAVRVKLTTNNATSIVMSATGEYFINENGRSFSGGSLTLRAANGVITATHSTQGEVFSGKAFTIKRAKMAPSAGSMTFNARNYLGHFNVKLLSTGYIQIVNEVPLAHYLYGVVAYEMNNSYPPEALKAQAVAAKSYVLTFVLASPKAEYHIGDTSSDQVYKGYNASYTNVINAVDSTIDKVLTVRGNILCTYYSASNGGETNLVTYAWPTRNASDAGYAISLDDYDIANASSLCETVKIPIRSSGTVSQGLYNLLVAKAYAAAGVQPTAVNEIKSADVHTPKFSGTTRNMSRVTVVMDVVTDQGTYADLSVTFNAADLYTYGAVANANLRCYWGEYAGDGSAFYIYHVRWGHGVGLSQRGAQQRASMGQSYADILAFYYPDAALASVAVEMLPDPVRPSTVVGMTPIGTGATTGEVNLRTGPGTNYTSLGMAPRNTALAVYELVNGWYHVALTGTSAEGWISASYVKFTAAATAEPPAPTPTPTNPSGTPAPVPVSYGVCTGEGVNFREGPGTNYKSIKKLARNAELSILSASSMWYYALAGGDYGYISASYVKVVAEASPTLTPSAPQTQTPDPGASASPTPGGQPGGVVEIGIITTGGVNFRTGPDASYQSLKKLEKNTGFILLGRAGKWANLLIGDVRGYVHEDYVKVTGTAFYSGNGGGNGGGTQTPAPAQNYGEGTTTGSVNLRVGPGVGYKALKVLSKATKLKLYEIKDGWYKATAPDGTEGWVSSKYVELSVAIPQKSETPATDPNAGGGSQTSIGTGVTNTTVNFREEPGTSAKIITQFQKDVRVNLFALKDGWYEAEYNGRRGYLYAKYVTVATEPAGGGSAGGVVPEGSGNAVSGGLTLAAGQASVKVNFRTGAATSGNVVIATLPAGTSFQVLGECGDYYYILYGGKTGFVYKPYTKVTSSGTAGIPAVGGTLTLIVTSTSAEVNLREGRGTASAKIKTLPNKTPLTVYLVLDGWCLVNAGGLFGWASADYVKLS